MRDAREVGEEGWLRKKGEGYYQLSG